MMATTARCAACGRGGATPTVRTGQLADPISVSLPSALPLLLLQGDDEEAPAGQSGGGAAGDDGDVSVCPAAASPPRAILCSWERLVACVQAAAPPHLACLPFAACRMTM